jgi:hypothetical protein
MDLLEFLRPSKSKIILALLIPYIYSGMVFLFGYVIAYITNSQVSFLFIPLPVLLIVSSLFESLITYPFTCGLITLFNKWRNKTLGGLRKDRKGLFLVSISIIIFNPLSLRLILLAVILIPFLFQEYGLPCGVLIADVFKGSPAERAGLQENEIILVIDDDNVRDFSRMVKILSEHKPGDVVKVMTDIGEYELELGLNPDTGGPYMGANFTNHYCDCGNGVCEPGEQVRKDNTTFTYCDEDCK